MNIENIEKHFKEIDNLNLYHSLEEVLDVMQEYYDAQEFTKLLEFVIAYITSSLLDDDGAQLNHTGIHVCLATYFTSDFLTINNLSIAKALELANFTYNIEDSFESFMLSKIALCLDVT